MPPRFVHWHPRVTSGIHRESHLTISIYFDQPRAEQRRRSNVISGCEWASAVCNNGNRKPEHEVLVKREESLESDLVTMLPYSLRLLDDGKILLVDVDQANRAGISTIVREGEFDILSSCRDLRCLDNQWPKNRDFDDVGIRTRSRNDNQLV